MSKWYVDKIKAAAPDLLDGDTADIMDWIDNAFAMYAEDADIAAKMDDAIKEQEEYYGVAPDIRQFVRRYRRLVTRGTTRRN